MALVAEQALEVLDAQEVATMLKCSVATVFRLSRTGKLSSARVGHLRRWTRKTVEEFINRQLRENAHAG